MGSTELNSRAPAFSLDSEVIKNVVDPVVVRVLRKNLRLRLNTTSKGDSDPAAEDAYQTVLLRLHQQITQDNGRGRPVGNIQHLAAVIAHNVCNDIIRDRCSEWKRTKDWLRHLFKSHQDLEAWQDGGKTLCGFMNWRSREENYRARHLTKYAFLEENLEKIKGEKLKSVHPKNVARPRLVEQILLWVGSPVNFDVLVDFVVHLTGVREIFEEPLDSNSPIESQHYTYRIDDIIDRGELLLGIWRMGQQLPPDQRRVFFLTEEDEHGHSLLKELIRGVVSPEEMCSALGISEGELIELWPDLALEPKDAAARLGQNHATVKQWRSRAKKKMCELIGLAKKKCA